MKIIRYADLVQVPWKNGGGVTREIAREEEGDEIVWRLSIADVASEGSFSAFLGLQRILTVIEGAGMVLDRPNEPPIAANLFEPVSFSGDEPINGLLPNGPCRDFNVIWNPKLTAASVTVATGKQKAVKASAGGITGLLCLEGAVQLPAGQALAPFDFAFFDSTVESASLSFNSIALLIHIVPVSKP